MEGLSNLMGKPYLNRAETRTIQELDFQSAPLRSQLESRNQISCFHIPGQKTVEPFDADTELDGHLTYSTHNSLPSGSAVLG